MSIQSFLNYPDVTVRSEHSPLRVVDSIPETRGVHDGQLQLHPLLLDVHRVLGDLHRLADALCGSETQADS